MNAMYRSRIDGWGMERAKHTLFSKRYAFAIFACVACVRCTAYMDTHIRVPCGFFPFFLSHHRLSRIYRLRAALQLLLFHLLNSMVSPFVCHRWHKLAAWKCASESLQIIANLAFDSCISSSMPEES